MPLYPAILHARVQHTDGQTKNVQRNVLLMAERYNQAIAHANILPTPFVLNENWTILEDHYEVTSDKEVQP